MAGLPDEKWLAEELREIKRRISELEGARGMVATTQHGGQYVVVGDDGTPRIVIGEVTPGVFGIDVLSNTGVVQTRLGEIDAGYGLEVVRGGVPISLADYVFGAQWAAIATSESTASGAYGDLATPGPSVSVTIGPSGRAFLLAGAGMDAVSTGAFAAGQTGGDFAFQASGANTIGSTIVGKHYGWDIDAANSTSFQSSPAGGRLLTGLNAGATTFKLVYRSLFGQNTSFENRWIFVQPL